ncbi:GIY-YIG nuclease family protein [Parapedobacter sp. 2B3]|uniref:GIY-YIG nuclease family protein n=1 Tax=Parapedobacter sp. 2B3 TaxID=3342381 RepID=UPI0035B5F9F9
MYSFYILSSERLHRYYTGSCVDLDKRLMEHNRGQSRYTKHGLPWRLVCRFEVSSRSEALKLEMKIKKRGAARFLSDLN